MKALIRKTIVVLMLLASTRALAQGSETPYACKGTYVNDDTGKKENLIFSSSPQSTSNVAMMRAKTSDGLFDIKLTYFVKEKVGTYELYRNLQKNLNRTVTGNLTFSPKNSGQDAWVTYQDGDPLTDVGEYLTFSCNLIK